MPLLWFKIILKAFLFFFLLYACQSLEANSHHLKRLYNSFNNILRTLFRNCPVQSTLKVKTLYWWWPVLILTWIVTHWKLNGQVHHLASLQVKNVFIDNVEVSIFLLESIYFGIKRAHIHICIYILLNKSLQESETFAYVSFPRCQWSSLLGCRSADQSDNLQRCSWMPSAASLKP